MVETLVPTLVKRNGVKRRLRIGDYDTTSNYSLTYTSQLCYGQCLIHEIPRLYTTFKKKVTTISRCTFVQYDWIYRVEDVQLKFSIPELKLEST